MKPNLPPMPKASTALPAGSSAKQAPGVLKRARLEELKRSIVSAAEKDMNDAVRILKRWLKELKA